MSQTGVVEPGRHDNDKQMDEEQVRRVADRLRALYTAAVYDIMDEEGLPHQCLDLGIKPLDRTMQIAGEWCVFRPCGQPGRKNDSSGL